jgi:hypothetical protein
MKKFRFLGIIAVAAIIGFSATSCGGNGGVDGSVGGGGWLGMELTFTNVQVTVFDDYGVPTNFTETRSVVNACYWNEDTGAWVSVGGTGAITGGLFTFNIADPYPLAPAEEHEWYHDWYYTFYPLNIAPADALFAALTFRTPYPHYERLVRVRSTQTIEEDLMYIWADRDVTITGTGGQNANENDGFTFTFISSNLNLNLREGWNAVHVRGAVISADDNHSTLLQTISHSHPNLPWVLFTLGGD